MDIVSAGTSVLALVAAAVQTSRTIYNVVSIIRSGSSDVLNLVSSASSLERILHQLSTLLDSQPELDPSQHLAPIEQTIRQCVADLDSICQQLWRLGHNGSVGLAKKSWRLLKIIIKKDDIQRMSRLIQHHISMLTLHVVILSSQETSQQSQLLFGLKRTLEAHHYPSGTSTLEKQDLSQQGPSATILALRSKLNRLPEAAATEVKITKSLKEKIQNHIGILSPQAEGLQHASDARTIQLDYDNLDEALRRLSELAQQEGRKAQSAEAEDIIEDIDMLITTLLRQYEQKRSGSRKRKRSHSHTEGVDPERSLKMVKSIMNTNQCIRLNQKARLHRTYPAHSQTVVERRSHTYTLAQGTASVFTKLTKQMKCSPGDDNDDPAILSFSAIVEYLPSTGLPYAKILAGVERYSGRFGSTTLYPSLSVSPVIPPDSEVFVSVQRGDLVGLMALLREGSASLRDCDPDGRSLLGYACSNDKPNICQFLLQQGADGDAVEKADYGDGDYEYLPLLLHCGTHDPDLECQRILLASGADPLEATEDEIGPFELALYNPALLNHIKYYARDLIDMEARDSGGDTLLLRFMHRYIYNHPALKFLLDQGADLRARTSRGNTCLHLCFRKACRYISDFRDDDLMLLPTLAMLIRAGAEVRAVNWAGESVSNVAQEIRQHDPWTQCDVGSFLVDTWLTVLRKLGYDPLEVMGGPALTHMVRFTQRYREEHYQAMQRWEPWMTSHVFDRTSWEWVQEV